MAENKKIKNYVLFKPCTRPRVKGGKLKKIKNYVLTETRPRVKGGK